MKNRQAIELGEPFFFFEITYLWWNVLSNMENFEATLQSSMYPVVSEKIPF